MLSYSLWNFVLEGSSKEEKNVSCNRKITPDEIDTGGGVKGNIWLLDRNNDDRSNF